MVLFLFGVLDGATKGGDLDYLGAETHVGESKAASDETSAAEQSLDLLRLGVGDHVEVLGLATEQEVSYAAAHQVRLEARLLKRVEDLQGAAADVGARDGVLGAGNTDGLGNGV